MNVSTNELKEASRRLHQYICKTHWNGRVIVGPDSGVRFNFRIGRFVKSYLNFLPWSDNYVFLQAQAYWLFSNWLMFDLFNDAQFQDIALACSKSIVAMQQPEGHWTYPPLPSRRGKIATVEGNYATLGVLESFRRTGRNDLLATGLKWYEFLVKRTGFVGDEDFLAINYWAQSSDAIVPNNTTLTLWTLAKLAEATNDDEYLAQSEAMIALLTTVQMDTGEIPYVVQTSKHSGRPHFLCYQYNAFQFLDLANYNHITGDADVLPILEKLALFLGSGISASGAAYYSCTQGQPEVAYYTAAVAAALSKATELELNNFRPISDRAYAWILEHQREDGSPAFFSRGDYRFLIDRRVYPRNAAMILYHLLLELQLRIQNNSVQNSRMGSVTS